MRFTKQDLQQGAVLENQTFEETVEFEGLDSVAVRNVEVHLKHGASGDCFRFVSCTNMRLANLRAKNPANHPGEVGHGFLFDKCSAVLARRLFAEGKGRFYDDGFNFYESSHCELIDSQDELGIGLTSLTIDEGSSAITVVRFSALSSCGVGIHVAAGANHMLLKPTVCGPQKIGIQISKTYGAWPSNLIIFDEAIHVGVDDRMLPKKLPAGVIMPKKQALRFLKSHGWI
jgi:hypothetical protein